MTTYVSNRVTSGNPTSHYYVDGVCVLSTGIDRSDSNKYKIKAGDCIDGRIISMF